MIPIKQSIIIFSLMVTLTTPHSAIAEEQTKKPSSSNRITHLKERALQFGRRFAGTKEFSSEEVQWTRAKTLAIIAAIGLAVTGTCYLAPWEFQKQIDASAELPAPPPSPPPPPQSHLAGSHPSLGRPKPPGRPATHKTFAQRQARKAASEGPKPWYNPEAWDPDTAPVTRACVAGARDTLSFVARMFQPPI